jgi:hypothetical protein
MLARHARRHAWHAELWDAVVPVLHDVDTADGSSHDPLVTIVTAMRAGDATTAERLAEAYGLLLPKVRERDARWLLDARDVADTPVVRVLDLVGRDHGAEADEARRRGTPGPGGAPTA